MMFSLVAKKYGNPRAVFCHGALRPGQHVRVIIGDNDDPRMVEGVFSGRRASNNQPIIRYRDDNGRVWMLPIDRRNILVEW